LNIYTLRSSKPKKRDLVFAVLLSLENSKRSDEDIFDFSVIFRRCAHAQQQKEELACAAIAGVVHIR
jgi:hypothetical protein